MLAVGEHLLGDLDDRTRRISTPFGGGLGGTHEELCGALSGGVLLIGALYGRAELGQDRDRCRDLAVRYRERFMEELGATICQVLRDSGYGSGGTPCSELTGRAARILLDVLPREG